MTGGLRVRPPLWKRAVTVVFVAAFCAGALLLVLAFIVAIVMSIEAGGR